MAIDVAAFTGTEAVGATEHSLTTDTAGPDSDTTAGIYQLWLDVNDMVLGDVLQIRCYEQARSGDTQRVVREWILQNAQSSPIWVSESLILGNGWDFTLDALSGTITVLWSIRQVA